MKYEDSELAEAAVLLAYEDASHKMPAALEKKLLAQGKAVAAEVRFTTTKAAAVSVEEPVEQAPPPRSIVRAWGGWFAAAACFSLFVYQWRVHSIEREVDERAAAVARSAARDIAIKEPSGRRVGTVRWDASARSCEVLIDSLPPSAEREHYRLWLSSSDGAHAVPVGAFVCSGECGNRTFALGSLPLESVKAVWLTRNEIAATVTQPEPTSIVGVGTDDLP